MKKSFKILIAFVLAIACFLSVGCDSGKNMDVKGQEFYENLVEQVSSVKEWTFDFSLVVSDEEVRANSLEEKTMVKGGVNLKDNITFAIEIVNVDTYQASNLEKYRSESNTYLYNNKFFVKSGNVFNGEKMSYDYSVEEIQGTESENTWFNEILNILPEIEIFINVFRQNNSKEISNFTKKAMEMLFTAKKVDDGYELSLDAEKVQILFNNLDVQPVKQVIDTYFGENAFQKLKDKVLLLFNMTVNEFKLELNEKSDNEFDKILKTIVELILKMEGEDTLSAQEIIDNTLQEYGERKLSSVISEFVGISENEFITKLGAIFGMFETTNLFYIIDVDTDIIKGYVTDYADDVQIVFGFDKDGILTHFNIDADISYEGEKLLLDFDVEFGNQFENIASKTSAILSKVK